MIGRVARVSGREVAVDAGAVSASAPSVQRDDDESVGLDAAVDRPAGRRRRRASSVGGDEARRLAGELEQDRPPVRRPSTCARAAEAEPAHGDPLERLAGGGGRDVEHLGVERARAPSVGGSGYDGERLVALTARRLRQPTRHEPAASHDDDAMTTSAGIDLSMRTSSAARRPRSAVAQRAVEHGGVRRRGTSRRRGRAASRPRYGELTLLPAESVDVEARMPRRVVERRARRRLPTANGCAVAGEPADRGRGVATARARHPPSRAGRSRRPRPARRAERGLEPDHAVRGRVPVALLRLDRVRRVVGGDDVDRAVGEGGAQRVRRLRRGAAAGSP